MTRQLLVVDDEERIREVVRACLEDLVGWRVILAESAEVALALAKTESLDAILLDVSMPDMDGFTLVKRLQADSTSRSIPVILLTAKVLPMDRERFVQLGVAGVISKPFDPIQISKQIANLLGWEDTIDML